MTASAAETDCRVMVFARAPTPGEAKTRLIPALGEAGAAALHRRLVMHCLLAARDSRLGPVHVPKNGKLARAPRERRQASAGLPQDLRSSPRNVAKQLRIKARKPDQRVATVFRRSDRDVIAPPERLIGIAKVPRR